MPPDYKKLYEIVCDLYSSTNHFYYGQWDETFYTLRVFETCKSLIKKTKMKVNEEVILTAAIFHDIGKTKLDTENKIKKEWDTHPIYGANLTREILTEQGFENEFIERVVNLVKHHDDRPGKVEMIRCDELKILQDADLLADMGIASFVRPFLYSGKNKRKTLENVNFIKTSRSNGSISKENLYRLNLGISKRIAKKLIRETDKLNNRIFKMTQSELLE
ncbi:MAG TPA: HD domain-containing protein [candidate division Zixibacteria bacterium]|nr:HD domain-containing protein [candidate division Zixibacteria bacterium]